VISCNDLFRGPFSIRHSTFVIRHLAAAEGRAEASVARRGGFLVVGQRIDWRHKIFSHPVSVHARQVTTIISPVARPGHKNFSPSLMIYAFNSLQSGLAGMHNPVNKERFSR
jgi:hypothetical protein